VEKPHSISRKAAVDAAGGDDSAEAVVDILSGLHDAHTWQKNMPFPRLIVVSKAVSRADSQCFHVNLAHEALIEWSPLKQNVTNKHGDLRVLNEFKDKVCKLENDFKKNRQAMQDNPLWTLDDALWTHERLKDVYGSIQRLGRDDELRDEERWCLGPMTPESVFIEINKPSTDAKRRRLLGERLSVIGDDREGTGVVNKVPQIEWCDVPGGTVTIKVYYGYVPHTRWPFPSRSITKEIKPFRISKYLITNEQFDAFISVEDGFTKPNWWDNFIPSARSGERPSPPQWSFANHPRNNVSWFAAMAFCFWLSKKLKLCVRLPNEWQWQLAAAGADGNPCNNLKSNLNRTTAVGMFPLSKSSVGAHDMIGNVWEWCLNKFFPAKKESFGPTDYNARVIRGCAWDGSNEKSNSSTRVWMDPWLYSSNVGFRVIQLIDSN
jgi:formylglycine-generating enzyme required for sulfatase activity